MTPLPGFRSLETDYCVTGSMRHVYVFHKHPCEAQAWARLAEVAARKD